MRNLMRKNLLSYLILILLVSLISYSVMASDYPSKTITLIAPFPAGGGVDSFSRGLTVKAKEYLGQTIVVKNVSGAGGAIGAKTTASAKPDGYTIMGLDTSLVTNILFQDVPFSLDSFEYLGTVFRGPTWIISPASKKWGSIENYIKKAKENPGVLSMGVAGPAGSQFLMALAFENYLNLDLNIIPYAGGGPLMAALLGGHVDAGIIHCPVGLDAVKSGDIDLLLAGGPTDSVIYDKIDEVPTFGDLGIPVEFSVFRSVFAPVGLSEDVKTKLVEGLKEMAESEEFIKFAHNWGLKPIWKGPEETEKMVRSDFETYKKVLEKFSK